MILKPYKNAVYFVCFFYHLKNSKPDVFFGRELTDNKQIPIL